MMEDSQVPNNVMTADRVARVISLQLSNYATRLDRDIPEEVVTTAMLGTALQRCFDTIGVEQTRGWIDEIFDEIESEQRISEH